MTALRIALEGDQEASEKVLWLQRLAQDVPMQLNQDRLPDDNCSVRSFNSSHPVIADPSLIQAAIGV